MKTPRFLLFALLLVVVPNVASAQGSGAVSLNWDTCSGPLHKTMAPGDQGGLVVSVLGHSQPHQAYQVYLALGSAQFGELRDAWRFDAEGCQGSSFITMDHIAPAALAKTCPSFQGALASIQIKDYSYNAATGRARAVLANTYPAGNTAQVNPAQRYFLARFLFDHTYSVEGAGTPGETCGGLEVPVCAMISLASWLSPGGVETPWALGQAYVTVNDPTQVLACPCAQDPCPTPAAATTWGAIKAQYKR